jgi:hypothetical protein
MGAVAQYLSLPQLQAHLGSPNAAQFVFNACRGHDSEAVEAKNSGNLVKSIAAFKSLPRSLDADLEDPACLQWVSLLVQEVVSRAESDAQRNKRYPRNCTIHYGLHGQVNSAGKLDMKSFRIPYPPHRLSASDRIAHLMVEIPNKIVQKECHSTKSNGPLQTRKRIRLARIGVCATELEEMGNSKHGSITTYFTASSSNRNSATAKSVTPQGPPTAVAHEEETSKHLDTHTIASKEEDEANRRGEDEKEKDMKLARQLQESYDQEHRTSNALEDNKVNRLLAQKRQESMPCENIKDDPDLELAKRLQASFDRENLVLGALDAATANKKKHELSSSQYARSDSQVTSKKAKTKKISAFFTASK